MVKQKETTEHQSAFIFITKPPQRIWDESAVRHGNTPTIGRRIFLIPTIVRVVTWNLVPDLAGNSWEPFSAIFALIW
jgi:hypothetical protein